jgi:trehalose 6-phosphate synthase
VTSVRPFPVSIDFEHHTEKAWQPEIDAQIEEWHRRLGQRTRFLGVGIDRVDYTKGIPERVKAIDLLFETHPEYVGQLTFIQVGVPSRTAIGSYEELNRRVATEIDCVNRRWQTARWQPIRFIHQHVDEPGLMALHRMADVCVVSSLHDGMNLVAKEYIASRADDGGALVLSRFTGSARELPDALLVNPFSTEEVANAIHHALSMPGEERTRRMKRMRAAVEANNIYRWAGKILDALSRVDVEPTSGASMKAGGR